MAFVVFEAGFALETLALGRAGEAHCRALFAGERAPGLVPARRALFQTPSRRLLHKSGLQVLHAAVAEVRLLLAAFAGILALLALVGFLVARVASRTLGHALVFMQVERRVLVQETTGRALGLDLRAG